MAKPFELWTAPGDRDIVRGRVSDAWASEIARDVNLAHAVFVLEIVLGNGARRRACPGGDWWEIEPAVRSVN